MKKLLVLTLVLFSIFFVSVASFAAQRRFGTDATRIKDMQLQNVIPDAQTPIITGARLKITCKLARTPEFVGEFPDKISIYANVEEFGQITDTQTQKMLFFGELELTKEEERFGVASYTRVVPGVRISYRRYVLIHCHLNRNDMLEPLFSRAYDAEGFGFSSLGAGFFAGLYQSTGTDKRMVFFPQFAVPRLESY